MKKMIMFTAFVSLLFALVPMTEAQAIDWADPTTGGEWTIGANWVGGSAPNGIGAIANIGTAWKTGIIGLTFVSQVTVGVIDNAGTPWQDSYVNSLSGTGPLIVDNGGAGARWDWGIRQGQLGFTLGVPVVLNDDLVWNSNSSVEPGWSMNQPISGTGQLHLKIGDDDNTTGPGTLIFMDMNVTNTYSGGTIVSSHPGWDAEHGATVRLKAEQSLGTGNVTLRAGLVDDPPDTWPNHPGYSPNPTTMTNSPVGSLWITDDVADTGGDGDNRIADTATLSLESWNDTVAAFYTWVHLDADVDETVARLIIDGSPMAPGTYGSNTSSAVNKLPDYFRGPGILTVVVPEPATLSLLALGGLAMLRRRRSC